MTMMMMTTMMIRATTTARQADNGRPDFHKWPFCPISALCSKLFPRIIRSCFWHGVESVSWLLPQRPILFQRALARFVESAWDFNPRRLPGGPYGGPPGPLGSFSTRSHRAFSPKAPGLRPGPVCFVPSRLGRFASPFRSRWSFRVLFRKASLWWRPFWAGTGPTLLI